jgi:hypothetical protein
MQSGKNSEVGLRACLHGASLQHKGPPRWDALEAGVAADVEREFVFLPISCLRYVKKTAVDPPLKCHDMVGAAHAGPGQA